VPTDGWKTHFMNTKFSSTYFHDAVTGNEQASFINDTPKDMGVSCHAMDCSHLSIDIGSNNIQNSHISLTWSGGEQLYFSSGITVKMEYGLENIPKNWDIFTIDPYGNYHNFTTQIGQYDAQKNKASLVINQCT
jgi:hypothetical protein